MKPSEVPAPEAPQASAAQATGSQPAAPDPSSHEAVRRVLDGIAIHQFTPEVVTIP